MVNNDGKAAWRCSRCRGPDGEGLHNYGVRSSCRGCGTAKGRCYGGEVQNKRAPTHRDSKEQRGRSQGRGTRAAASPGPTWADLKALERKMSSKNKQQAAAGHGGHVADGRQPEAELAGESIDELHQQITQLKKLPDGSGLLAKAVAERKERIDQLQGERDAEKEDWRVQRDLQSRLEKRQHRLEGLQNRCLELDSEIARATGDKLLAEKDITEVESEIAAIRQTMAEQAARCALDRAGQGQVAGAEALPGLFRTSLAAAEIPDDLGQRLMSALGSIIQEWRCCKQPVGHTRGMEDDTKKEDLASGYQTPIPLFDNVGRPNPEHSCVGRATAPGSRSRSPVPAPADEDGFVPVARRRLRGKTAAGGGPYGVRAGRAASASPRRAPRVDEDSSEDDERGSREHGRPGTKIPGQALLRDYWAASRARKRA